METGIEKFALCIPYTMLFRGFPHNPHLSAHIFLTPLRLTFAPQNTVDVPLDNVVLLDLLFQPVIVGVERFFLFLDLYILRLQRGDIGELAAYAGQHPDQCRQTDADPDTGCMEFEIRKGRLSFRLTAPYSEERRRAASAAAKKSGVHRKDAGR